MNKIVIWYLEKQIKRLSWQEESLEMNQDITENVNAIWQETRRKKDIFKSALEIIEEPITP